MTSEKTHINLVVIGHLSSGKSTITGYLKYQCGGIDKRTLYVPRGPYEQPLSSANLKQHIANLGHGKNERERGITIDIHRGLFETEMHKFSVTDTPGHRDFIKNMITGISQADSAILIVASAADEFKAKFSRPGLTREHALIASVFGIKQLIVCINKMDDPTTNWSQDRFDEIVQEVGSDLRKIAYNPTNVSFIPISGWLGDNIVEKSSNMPWYTGPCLIEALDLITPPKCHLDQPLRLPIQDVYEISGIGTVAVGRVVSGVFKCGMHVNFTPGNITRQVMSIEMHNQTLLQAVSGDIVGFNVKNLSVKDIHRGLMVSDSNNDPAKVCSNFTALILVLNHHGLIRNGHTAVIDCHTAHVTCRFDYIRAKINRSTGAVIEEDPQFIRNGDCAICTFVPQKAMCVETFAEYPPLGRFSIRNLRQVVAVGVVKSVQKHNSEEKNSLTLHM